MVIPAFAWRPWQGEWEWIFSYAHRIHDYGTDEDRKGRHQDLARDYQI